MRADLEDKILAAAISAIVLLDSEESIISISPGRNKGSLWFQEHTRASIGKMSLSNQKSERSI
jgi:hypothetical protein|tara:strand:+ start:233 stop:421 length:189 start_codon:yes stop_codon:yes gene_type:complete